MFPCAAGVRVALCTDNLLLSGNHEIIASPTNELLRYLIDCGGSIEALRGIMINSAQAAFSPASPEWLEQYTRELDAVIAECTDDRYICLS